MPRIRISQTKDSFLHDGHPWFWLADTCWSAFTNADEREWTQYLDHRHQQGFTAVQINVLPQWDASETDLNILPFARERGRFDYRKVNAAYFDRAERMCQAVVDRGMVPALVVLWCNYVPGTWGARRMPDCVIPRERVAPLVEMMVRRFARFEPIWIVSGDTNFEEAESIAYYKEAAEIVRREDPEGLRTLHLCGCFKDVPSELVDASWYDFYMYQSGHGLGDSSQAYLLAGHFAALGRKRPVINSEPCYEGHAPFGNYGRFSAFDARRAAWQSLLAGASAGVTYGAHGIWSWHHSGKRFAAAEGSSTPIDWRVALQFEGAWDYAFARWIFDSYGLHGIQRSDRITAASVEVRMGLTRDQGRFAVYAPYSTGYLVDLDLSKYELTLLNLATRRAGKPVTIQQDGKWLVERPEANADTVLLGKLR